MARVASFTSSGTPVGGRGTLAQLMAKKKMLAEQQGDIMAPRQIESWTQGAAQLAQSFINARQQRGAEQEETAGREQFAQAMAGIDWTKGASPEQLQTILALDPDAGQRIMEQSANRALEELKYKRDVTRKDFEWSREQTDQEADEARQAAAQAEVDRVKREQELQDRKDELAGKKQRIITGPEAEAAGYDPKRQYKVSADGTTLEDVTVEDKSVRVVTGPEAEALGYDGKRSWEIPAGGGAAKDVTVKPEAPASGSGKLEKDIADGVYGDINDPKVAAYVQKLRDKEATATGAATNRGDVWKMQDAYVNSSSALTELQEAQQLLKQGIDFGYLVNLRQGLAKSGWAGDPELAKRTDRYNKIMSKEAITAMANTLAGADSDKDMQRFLFILNDETAAPEVRGAALDGLIAKTRSHQELQRNRIIEGGGEVPAQPSVNDEATELAEAQAAIDKGADAEMVRKRFADKGFDPSKLKDKAGY